MSGLLAAATARLQVAPALKEIQRAFNSGSKGANNGFFLIDSYVRRSISVGMTTNQRVEHFCETVII